MQSRQKLANVPTEDLQVMAQILETVIKRYAFPSWCEVSVEPDDDQIEYQKYRELLKTLFLNFARIKELTQHLLSRADQEVDSFQTQ